MRTVQNGARDLVLGAGGIKGFGHLGLLRAMRERNIVPHRVIGVSIGSAIATLHANGFTEDQSRDILLDAMHRFDKGGVARFLRRFNPVKLYRQGGIIELRTLFEDICARYSLRPQPNLAIVAYDLARRKPVLFEGTDYDLVSAVCGSCSVPVVMRTTSYGQVYPPTMRLVDGGVYHPCPTEFSPRPAIVSQLGLATKSPREKLPFVDRLFHFGEQMISRWWQRRFKRPRKQDLLIRTGKPDVAVLSFSARESTFLELEKYGYETASREFDKAIRSGAL
ncbi:MAG: patatin-like phospholipase family protein [Candidatus Obscuribacterales bacterium]|nr:patatin-like phospholipase family protein [Candidatus Obscuribacterales bacterium]